MSLSIESSGDIFPPEKGDIQECRNCGHEYIIVAADTENRFFTAAVHPQGNIGQRLLHRKQEFALRGNRLRGRCPFCKATLRHTAESAREVDVDIYPKRFCKFYRCRKRKERLDEKYYSLWRRASHAAAHSEPFLVINADEEFIVGIIQHESLDENYISHYVHKLLPLIAGPQRVVILDLCILRMLRGASDAVFINIFRRLKEQERELRLACPQEAVLRKLEVSRLIRVFHCYSSLQDAIAARNRIV